MLVARCLVVLDGLALLVTLTTVLLTAVTQRPLGLPPVLLAPAIPLLVGGQLWVILRLRQRQPARRGFRVRGPIEGASRLQSSRLLFFGGLAKPAAYAITAIFVGGWLAAMLSTSGLSQGNPTRGPASCPWELNDHGTVTCVSHAEYQRVQADVERFATGILSGFFVVHFGVALSELRRRRGDPADPSAPIVPR